MLWLNCRECAAQNDFKNNDLRAPKPSCYMRVVDGDGV
jgi:hypothetical protein